MFFYLFWALSYFGFYHFSQPNCKCVIPISKMDYSNMRAAELKALMRESRLGGYSRLKKAELIALLCPAPQTRHLRSPTPQRQPRPSRPPPPPPQMQSVRFRPDRPRQPNPQEMDIFEQQEMSKSRPQVTSKLNDWYDWLINHVP